MNRRDLKGATYRCEVCGAEVAVLAPLIGAFEPRCCNQPMQVTPRRLHFYVCPVCGAEVGALLPGSASFMPRCCNAPMVFEAA
ncbi:MAG: hypothetical protein ACYTGB_05690 [Planctomycetota bacterium]|jgi:predicted RNA-binding Zn-ribbon protein involved in translation (DUF1610 family)